VKAVRKAEISRKTNETDIKLSLVLEGAGRADIVTDCGFLAHMLELFARHGRFDLRLDAKGDSRVDFHHTVEDTGIVLGRAFSEALGTRRGIRRYGSFILPMDESCVAAAVDISGRAALVYGVNVPAEKVGDFDTELAREFWAAFSRELKCALHFSQLSGGDSHHLIEACFKGMARALKDAVSVDPDYPDEVPSTKGTVTQ
jgi:imidazoleglycerol-phosphate dehydratase